MAQLKCYYFDFSGSLAESPFTYQLLGLNLLCLLSQLSVSFSLLKDINNIQNNKSPMLSDVDKNTNYNNNIPMSTDVNNNNKNLPM